MGVPVIYCYFEKVQTLLQVKNKTQRNPVSIISLIIFLMSSALSFNKIYLLLLLIQMLNFSRCLMFNFTILNACRSAVFVLYPGPEGKLLQNTSK